MFLSRWFQRRRRPAPTYRPTALVLEDRTVPARFGPGFGFGFGSYGPLLPAAGPATHLQVIVPENVQSGQSFDVLVEAEDASNRLATGYTGTVQLSLGTTDPGATLPAAYTFSAADHGIHEFHVTLAATGGQTLTATDTTTSSITGSAGTTVNPAPVATHFLVLTPENATVGVPTPVTVVALDASNHIVQGYTGTVHFTSTDTAATLPADYTFTSSDNGRHTFEVTFNTPGTQTVTATDTATGSTTGQATTMVAAVGAVTHFGVIPLGPALAGSPTAVAVVALDASNHIVAGYTGTVHFTSSDTGATLPADYTFTAADDGVHVFTVTFTTPGRQTLTATDTTTSSITGTANVRLRSLAQNPFFDYLWGAW